MKTTKIPYSYISEETEGVEAHMVNPVTGDERGWTYTITTAEGSTLEEILESAAVAVMNDNNDVVHWCGVGDLPDGLGNRVERDLTAQFLENLDVESEAV